MERKVLGKGLSALIPDSGMRVSEKSVTLAVEKIVPNRYQPRREFNREQQEELIASIREKGVIQPILVRRMKGGAEAEGKYELIAGERRLRAAKTIGIKEVPVVIRDATDMEAVELSLIENIQREQLNAMEEAEAYQRLLDEFSLTQEQIAQAVGKERTSVANSLRLLKLPEKIKRFIIEGKLSGGHARALLGVSQPAEQVALAEKAIRRGLSVREVEEIAARKRARGPGAGRRQKDPHATALEEELQHLLGTRVKIIAGRRRGRIQIEYYSLDDLERLRRLFKSIDSKGDEASGA